MTQQIFIQGPQHPTYQSSDSGSSSSSSVAVVDGNEEQGNSSQVLFYRSEDDGNGNFEPETFDESDVLLQALSSDQCDFSTVISDILQVFGVMAEPAAAAETPSAINAPGNSSDSHHLGGLSTPEAPDSPTKRQRDATEDGPDAKRLKSESQPEPNHEAEALHLDGLHRVDNDKGATGAQTVSEELLPQSGLSDEVKMLKQEMQSANVNGGPHKAFSQEVESHGDAHDEPFELGAIDDWVKSALEGSKDFGDYDGASVPGHVTEAVMEDDSVEAENTQETKRTAHLAELSFVADPSNYIKNTSLPSLGNLSMSILETLSSDEVMDEPESEFRQRFDGLSRAFGGIVELYTDTDGAFSDSSALLDFDAPKILTVARMALVGLWAVRGDTPPPLDSHIDILLSEFPGCTSAIADLYIDLKTQAIIRLLLSKEPEKSSKEIVESAVSTCQAEMKDLMQRRTDELMTAAVGSDDFAALSAKYSLKRSLASFVLFARRHLRTMLDLAEKLGVYLAELPVPESPESTVESILFGESDVDSLVNNVLANVGDREPTADVKVESVEMSGATATANLSATVNGFSANDYESLSALVAESTDNYVRTTLNSLTPTPYQPTVPPSTTESMTAHLNNIQQSNSQPSYYAFTQSGSQACPDEQGGDLPPHQSVPTSTLYDRARQAALSKNTTHARREGITSTRRPWSQEEEKALMAGLDMVKGPHWSQILTLFGINGTISDVLRDRSQVQLKDKARNLKLFFLKTNSEMPYYLHAVTGELKTRAPGQAARKEAEERARINSEEEQARVQGIMTLAGGLQHPPQSRASGSPSAAAVSAGVVTPAQAAAQAQMNGSSSTLSPNVNRLPTTQQVLHAIAQPVPRPQAQTPPHLPHTHTPQHTHKESQQMPAQQVLHPATASHAQTPTAPLSSNTITTTPTATPPQPSPLTQPQVQPPTQNASPPPLATTTTTTTNHPTAGAQINHPCPVPKVEANSPALSGSIRDDNAADAEILRGLQAAIAVVEQSVKVEATSEA